MRQTIAAVQTIAVIDMQTLETFWIPRCILRVQKFNTVRSQQLGYTLNGQQDSKPTSYINTWKTVKDVNATACSEKATSFAATGIICKIKSIIVDT